ncbi:MAG: molybdenum cofactor biosynthesis protein MoaE [Cellvibrionaceae bacterium]
MLSSLLLPGVSVPLDSINIQEHDFNHAEEYEQLRNKSPNIGAIVTFCGLVRDFDNSKGQHLFLEHFSGMTEKVLTDIVQQSKERWPIIDVRITHRVGLLNIGEQIVFVGVNSQHRESAFQACEFIMDFLKTQAPFWKKAITEDKNYWIEAKQSDEAAKKRWET